MARTTDKREAILRFITDFMRNQGYPPSVREICAGVGLASTATVHYHLNALKEEGLIHMDGNIVTKETHRRCLSFLLRSACRKALFFDKLK